MAFNTRIRTLNLAFALGLAVVVSACSSKAPEQALQPQAAQPTQNQAVAQPGAPAQASPTGAPLVIINNTGAPVAPAAAPAPEQNLVAQPAQPAAPQAAAAPAPRRRSGGTQQASARRTSRDTFVDFEEQRPQKRSFWSKHRDKLTVAAGAGAGAAIGGLAGGKKGAAIGAIGGGVGSAVYTYGIRKRNNNQNQ
jgi:hypothetical protein